MTSRLSIVLRVGLAAVASILLACGDAPAGFAEPCSGTGDCADGLFCGTSGSARGLCTLGCSENTLRVCDQFGEAAFCSVEGTCLMACSGGCADGTYCNTRWIPDICEADDE